MDYIDPPVTRIVQPVEDMAKLAVRILMTDISTFKENPEQRRQSMLQLTPELIKRDSVRKID